MRRALFPALALALATLALPAWAATIQVRDFGDHGWKSDDTRDLLGVNLVGLNNTHYGKPGQTPTAADDVAIDNYLQFVAGPAGSTYGGALKVIQPDDNLCKATLSVVDLLGFAPASDLVSGSFSATYKWYMEPNATARTLAFRLGIQSTAWTASQSGFTAIRSGEPAWDLTLVHIMSSPVANAWNEPTVDLNNGTWYLYGQAGNGNWTAIAGAAPPGGTLQQTLAAWQADPTWGPLLFGAGAKVTQVNFGLGSSQRNCNAYVDYLQTTLLNGGDVIDFAEWLPVQNLDTGEFFATIQGALDDAETLAGHTIVVAAGTYREQLYITKGVTLQGAGAGLSVIEAVDTGARTTRAITNFDGSARTIDPCVLALGAGTVTIDGFTVDGRDLGPNYFYGVYLHDTSGAVSDCTIANIRYAASPSAGNVASLVANHSPGQTATVAFTGNTIPNMQKGGILVMGPGIVCDLDGNSVTATPSGSLAGNGIQVSYGSSGTLTDNVVAGTVYTGSDWSASGILLFESGSVTVAGGEVYDCQTGIGYSQWNWLYTPPATPSVVLSGVYAHDNDWNVSVHLADDGVDLDLEVGDCDLVDNTYSGLEIWGSTVDPWGGAYYGGWANGSCVADLHGNTITGNDYGFDTYRDTGVATTNTLAVTARDNDFSGNASYGVYNNFDDQTLDCVLNWWGSFEGPTLVMPKGGASVSPPVARPSNPAGEELPAAAVARADLAASADKATGVNVSPYVDFEPWTGQTELSIVPATSGPINCGDVPTLTFHYVADPTAIGFKGYTVTVESSAELTFGPADIDISDPPGVSFGFPQKTEVVAGHKYIIDYAIMLPAGFAFAGTADLFTIDFHPTGSGTGTVTLSDITFRDINNVGFPVVEPGPATITVDCDAPDAVSGITAAPGHRKVDVSWTASPSADVALYEIWRAKWHRASPAVSAYPEYDDYGDAVIPAHVASYPPGAEWTLAGTVPTGTLAYTDTGDTNRGVYYYEVFAVDTAANPSGPAPAYDRATNYWLGDVATETTGDYDGLVAVADVSKLGAAYGLTIPTDGQYFQVDVGPTDDMSRVGIPTTDSTVDFEDLMVFAMNFGVVMPKAPAVVAPAPVVLAWSPVDDRTWTLRLAEPCASLQGLNLAAILPDGMVASVQPGDLLGDAAAPYFLKNVDGHGLDAGLAVLGHGATIAGTGELLRVTLPGPADLATVKVTARGTDNSRLEVRLAASSTPSTPLAFRLSQNVPNPFNPMTRIAFALPSAQTVRLDVFALDGSRVATLVNEPLGAGTHEIVWDGRDAGGRQVASGTYFFRIDAGPYSETRKMTLMK